MSEAHAYHSWQLGLGVLRVLLTAGYLATLLATGTAARLRDLLAAWTTHWWLAVPSAVIVLASGHQLLTLPLTWLGSFELPRRYGLNHETLGQWLRDRIKGGLIGAGLASAGALVVYGLLRSTPWWWLWAAAAFAVGGVLLAFVMPIWLVPLFYRLTPLAEGDLRSRLLRLAERAHVHDEIAHRVEEWPRACKGLRLAAGHDRQRPVLRLRRRPGHRRVHEPHAMPRELLAGWLRERVETQE